jgi:hypothetical protein
MRSAILAVVSLASLALAAPSNLIARESANEVTERLLFKSTMAQFQSARAAQDPNTLDWTSNGCSSSPDNPLGFNCA